MPLLKMTALDLAGKRLLIRADLNVPMQAGQIVDATRIRAAWPTIQWALQAGAQVMVTSHLGRPIAGNYQPAYSLQPVADYLSQQQGRPVPLIRNWLPGDFDVAPGQLVMLENVRFHRGEQENDTTLAKQMAALCDIYVMDAFATAHRAHASTHGISQYAPLACAGPLLISELNALNQALHQPKRPLVAIVGGAKVSTKLPVLTSLATVCDQLIVGGGIANTFLAAAGTPIGASLYEQDLLPQANALMATVNIPLPTDAVVGKALTADEPAITKPIDAIAPDDCIFDIGPATQQQFIATINNAQTILWNGPVGVFESAQFSAGTRALAIAIAQASACTIAGGGDTLAAIDQYGIKDSLSYISTGGGAFLAVVEGKTLPAIAMLEQAAARQVNTVRS